MSTTHDRKTMELLNLLLMICGLSLCIAVEDLVVQTPLGKIKGSLMTTRLNKTIYAFRGVRYGKSTEGDKRFKIAEPVDPWSDVFDASIEGPSCPSPETMDGESEDCLRLNVYTTKLSNSTNKVNRPVIVFFHPGGFYGFSALSSVFGPQYYLDQDIVLVTVNYRLATLGFISTGDASAPGNLGLKDQVEALRWIQKNIVVFGGNPGSVTITGYSAGSWSVVLHLMSPMSKGLFHRAIASSGAPTTPESLPTEQKDFVLRQARYVNCSADNLDVAIECLKSVPHKQLSKSFYDFNEWYGDPILRWSPVVEPEVPGIECFLTDQPVDLIKQGRFQHVPLVTGITKDEFAGIALIGLEQALAGNDSIYKNLTEKWEHAAPISFQYERDTRRSKHISRQLRKFYFNNEAITVENGKNLGLIYADAIIGFPAHRFANLMAKYSRAPIYYYQFTYQGRYSFAMWKDTKKPYGVVHHDDLQYLFFMPFLAPFFNVDDPEVAMVEKLGAMWANFARTGEPIPREDDKFSGVKWPALTPKNKEYMEIGNELRVEKDMFPKRYALWERLFPLCPPFDPTKPAIGFGR